MYILLLLIAGIFFGVRLSKLESRIKALEDSQSTHATSPALAQASAQSAQRDASLAPTETPATRPAVQASAKKAEAPNEFMEWLGRDWLVKLGALLLLIGFGWFVSYAFANDWIGPLGRIALGLSAGVLILILGAWRIETHLHQGGIFTALGSTIVLLTVFAAREMYGFFTPTSALTVMFFTVLIAMVIAVTHKSERLALVALLLGIIAPLFTAAPEPDVVGLFTYLAIVTAGALIVVYRTGWRSLTLGSLVAVFCYGLVYIDSSGADQGIAYLFALAFTAVFFITNVASIVHGDTDEAKTAHVVTGIGTTLYLILWIAIASAPELKTIMYGAWALTFGIGTFILYSTTKQQAPFYIYGASAIALIGAATINEFSGPVLQIVLSLEIGIFVALVTRLISSRAGSHLAWLFVIPLGLSFSSLLSSAWETGFIHDDFFALLAHTLVMGATGTYLFAMHKAEGIEKQSGLLLLIVAGLYALSLIWLVLHSVLPEDTATMFSLVIYTVLGLIIYVQGRMSNHATLKTVGGFLLGAVIVRLLLIEVWEMALAGRIITFFVIGALLISTAFFGRSGAALKAKE